MSSAVPPHLSDLATTRQLPTEQLVNIRSATAAGNPRSSNREPSQLTQEVNRLKVNLALDSQTSSKPPSTDLLKKPEKALITTRGYC